MGDLRDQLKKANILSKKDAKRIAHEERLHRSKVGGAAGVEKERQDHTAELRAKQEAKRDADRKQQAKQQAQRDATAERLACEELLRSQVQRPGRRGATKFYFQLADGRLPALDLAVPERMQIADGSLCVVRMGSPGSHDYGLLRTDHAQRVAAVFPDRVVFGAAASSGSSR